MFSKLEWKSVDNFKGLINWVAMSSNEGLTLKTSALEFLHVGQFTLWTQSIKLSLFCNTPPPLRHSVSDSLETILRLFWIFWQNPWPRVIHDDAGFMKKKNQIEVKKNQEKDCTRRTLKRSMWLLLRVTIFMCTYSLVSVSDLKRHPCLPKFRLIFSIRGDEDLQRVKKERKPSSLKS